MRNEHVCMHLEYLICSYGCVLMLEHMMHAVLRKQSRMFSGCLVCCTRFVADTAWVFYKMLNAPIV